MAQSKFVKTTQLNKYEISVGKWVVGMFFEGGVIIIPF